MQMSTLPLRRPTRGNYAEIAAAGSTQATAAEITADFVVVTSLTETTADGVLLPPGNLWDEVVIVNGTSTANLKIYPRSGGKINNAAANAALELPPNSAAHFIGVNNLNWAAFF
jgi:hypothetical protein